MSEQKIPDQIAKELYYRLELDGKALASGDHWASLQESSKRKWRRAALSAIRVLEPIFLELRDKAEALERSLEQEERGVTNYLRDDITANRTNRPASGFRINGNCRPQAYTWS